MVDTEVTIGVRLALSAGLRREEICGLRWRDVDFDADVIRVRSAVTEVDGEVHEKGPKTEISLMGHADAAMTLNIYASADPKARQQAAEIVAEAMAERPEPKLRLCVS